MSYLVLSKWHELQIQTANTDKIEVVFISQVKGPHQITNHKAANTLWHLLGWLKHTKSVLLILN